MAEQSQTTSIPAVSIDDNSTSTNDKPSLKDRLKMFGKKISDKQDKKDATTGLSGDSSQARSTSPAPAAPSIVAPTSPPRVGDSSDRVASPASSQIFERNVQEESFAPSAVPEGLPNHIATENHIPPALDAASEAITNERLNPDSVEIVTHVSHQPAAISVAQGTGAGSISGMASATNIHQDSSIAAAILPSIPPTSEAAVAAATSVPTTTSGPGATTGAQANDDAASSYGDLNPTDVRRLSFISFADVVHHEQAQSIGSETASQLPGGASPLAPQLSGSILPVQGFSPNLTAASPALSPAAARSPSPQRTASPPMRAASPNFLSANAASPKIIGGSPSPPTGVSGELAMETMSQALRKTGSGDLSAARDRHASETIEGLGVR